MSNIESLIDHFESRTLEQIELIGKSPDGGRRSIHHKVLYASILDSLSIVVHAHIENNRLRYTGFVKEFAKWEYGDRVSILHVLRYSQMNPDPELSELKAWALEWWNDSLGISNPVSFEAKGVLISTDPDLKSVEEFWPKGRKLKNRFCHLTPEHFQHYNLLYRARNALVHEFRDPGDASEWPDDANPYYQEVKQIVDFEPTGEPKLEPRWELVYPVQFYKTLCLKALKNLVGYMRTESLSPYKHYSDGSFWLKELN